MTSKNQNDSIKLQVSQKFLPYFPYLIILVGIIFIGYSVVNPVSDPFTRITAISAFFTAVLTGLYVVVNSKQLDVMAKQLNEMKYDRELQNQPLPWVYKADVSVIKPRVFYTPPEKKEKRCSTLSKYSLDFALKNVSNIPAVCIDVSSYITLSNKGESKKLEATSIRINALEGMSKYPFSNEEANFHFVGDNEGALLNRLIDGDISNFPILTIRIIYKNIIGACFALSNDYRIYPVHNNHFSEEQIPNDQIPIFKNWLTQIMSFNINYNSEINKLLALKEARNRTEGDVLFQHIQEKFNSSLIGEEVEKLFMAPINGSFSVKPISNDEYNEVLKDVYYGTCLGKWVDPSKKKEGNTSKIE